MRFVQYCLGRSVGGETQLGLLLENHRLIDLSSALYDEFAPYDVCSNLVKSLQRYEGASVMSLIKDFIKRYQINYKIIIVTSANTLFLVHSQ